MSGDPRLTPANGRVAAAHLRGQVAADRFVEGAARRLSVPVADLAGAPGGKRERQLLAGARVTLYDETDGWAFVQAANGYVGYVRAGNLTAAEPVSHVVQTLATHAYAAPDIKARDQATLSLGAQVLVTGQTGRFCETPLGFIPARHLRPIDRPERDPVAVAERFLGTPYLWGGNSRLGIDCSGLVEAACAACGIACPGDSDLQQAALGNSLADNDRLRRGDLLFWPGHVALVAGPDRILHANAHDMAVAYEGLDDALHRIEDSGGGTLTSRRRVP